MTPVDSSIRIRDASEDDKAAIDSLTLAAYEQFATIMAPSAWAGLKTAVVNGLSSTAPAERIVAERNGVLIGSVMLFPPDVKAYSFTSAESVIPELRLLAVSPEARGQGLGRILINECISRARQSGAAELGLHSSKSMQAAIHLYESMGFVRVPEDDFQPDGTELIMAYRLRL